MAYTEMVAKTAAFILQEVYDNFRLWAVSPHTISFSRELDLVPILGNRENVDEYLHLLRVVERTDFAQLPPTWRARGEKKEDSSPGRVGPGGDWLYYDPFARRAISEADAKRFAARERPPIPEGHPMGFDFDTAPDGWVSHDTAGENRGGGDDSRDRPAFADVGGWESEDARMEDLGSSAGMGYRDSGPEPLAAVVSDPVPGDCNCENDAEVVRRFLRECGVDERYVTGSWVELRGYLRGRLS